MDSITRQAQQRLDRIAVLVEALTAEPPVDLCLSCYPEPCVHLPSLEQSDSANA